MAQREIDDDGRRSADDQCVADEEVGATRERSNLNSGVVRLSDDARRFDAVASRIALDPNAVAGRRSRGEGRLTAFHQHVGVVARFDFGEAEAGR